MLDPGEMFLEVESISAQWVTLRAYLVLSRVGDVATVDEDATTEIVVGELTLPRNPRVTKDTIMGTVAAGMIPREVAASWKMLQPGERLSGTFMLLPEGMPDAD